MRLSPPPRQHPIHIRSYPSTKTEADPTQRARKNNFSTACKFGEKQKKPTSELRCQSHVYICVCVWQSMRTCVWVCACLCMSVCCCTLGSCCRFEVGSPGAHSDNCTSIIFCSSILCSFFFPFTVLHYLNICLIAAYYFFLFSRFARELSKLKNMTKFGSGRSPRRQCEFIAGCVGIYPCNCSTHTVTMYV